MSEQRESVPMVCACGSLDHVIQFHMDEEYGELHIDVMLNHYLPWWRRLWLACRYVTGWGAGPVRARYDSFLFDERDLGALEGAIRRIQVARVASWRSGR
jgi:hypothetical protein